MDKSLMFNVRLSHDEKRALRIRAAENGIDMSEYVRKLLRSDLGLPEDMSFVAKVSPDVYQDAPRKEPHHAA